ncbi:nuclease-related domain-containing protein [uncultured Fibrobacter sp.]|uniref:nuclease-related domain-containing protein n=1 Tax=uncultured Fibrobacter sp. TaxID=261512 RepID=UPI0025CCBA25|nr:nuclease-related domain-containing protein [uncultured Fibrobacter sp.]
MTNDYFMQSHQARNVKWKDGLRTIGEMLDDGSMTLEMLQTGMNNENEQIKAACTVLKAERENQIKEYIAAHGMPRNLDEARAVVWPYDRRTQKPGWTIGQLLDTHIISQDDLNYAIRQRWNEQVYRACVIILSNMLNIENKKILSGNGPLAMSVNRSSFMSEEGEVAIYKRGFWIGLVFALWIVFALGDVCYLAYHIIEKNLIGGLIGLNWLSWIVIIVGVAFGSFAIIKILNLTVFRHIDNLELDIKHHKQGQIGEDKVADAFRESLDGSCHIFRNYHIDGKKQDIDEILLSPWGVFAIEIKNYNGVFELRGNEFYRKIGKKFIKEKDKRNPIKQASGNAIDLKHFLEPILSANNCRAWVTAVLIWANSDVTSYDKDCSIDVWKINDLPRKLDALKQGQQKISEKCYKEIEQKLMKSYDN